MTSEPAQYSPGQSPIDIATEDQNGGHTIQKHVAKSDEFLLNRIATEQYGNWFYSRRLASAGSFLSLEEANGLIDSTIAQNVEIVRALTNGDFFDEPFAITSIFNTVTGKEAYADTESGLAYMRKTNAVKVVLRRDTNRINGFYVLTAYPITI